MRRILISECDGMWSFERFGEAPLNAGSPLRAAIAAMEYGETLHGKALGYIIRLEHSATISPETLITLHTELF